METGAQALLTIVAIGLALDCVLRREDRHFALWATLATAYLLRMDMAIVAVAIEGFLLAALGRELFARRSWWRGLALFAAAVVALELFRLAYFHDPLPNTYYLKLTGVPLGVRLLRGGAAFGHFAAGHAALLALVVLAAAWYLPRRREGRPLVAVLLAGFAYSVWVGGDTCDFAPFMDESANRFVAFLVPLLFVLGNGALNEALAGRPAARARQIAGLAPVALVILGDGLLPSPSSPERFAQLVVAHLPDQVPDNRAIFDRLTRFEKLLGPGAVAATVCAGVPAFFTDHPWIDILGYNDRRTARLPSAVPLTTANYLRFWPGHMKWDYDDLLRRRPDAVFQTWELTPAAARSLFEGAGYLARGGFWLRRDSPRILSPGGSGIETAPRRSVGSRPSGAAAGLAGEQRAGRHARAEGEGGGQHGVDGAGGVDRGHGRRARARGDHREEQREQERSRIAPAATLSALRAALRAHPRVRS